MENFLEVSSQQILVGTILVGRVGVAAIACVPQGGGPCLGWFRSGSFCTAGTLAARRSDGNLRHIACLYLCNQRQAGATRVTRVYSYARTNVT